MPGQPRCIKCSHPGRRCCSHREDQPRLPAEREDDAHRPKASRSLARGKDTGGTRPGKGNVFLALLFFFCWFQGLRDAESEEMCMSSAVFWLKNGHVRVDETKLAKVAHVVLVYH